MPRYIGGYHRAALSQAWFHVWLCTLFFGSFFPLSAVGAWGAVIDLRHEGFSLRQLAILLFCLAVLCISAPLTIVGVARLIFDLARGILPAQLKAVPRHQYPHWQDPRHYYGSALARRQRDLDALAKELGLTPFVAMGVEEKSVKEPAWYPAAEGLATVRGLLAAPTIAERFGNDWPAIQADLVKLEAVLASCDEFRLQHA